MAANAADASVKSNETEKTEETKTESVETAATETTKANTEENTTAATDDSLKAKFESQKPSEHFEFVNQYLKENLASVAAEHLEYLSLFADHYAIVGNYFPNKELFHSPSIIATLISCLNTSDVASLRLALKLIMIFSRYEANHKEVDNVNGIQAILNAMKVQSDLEVRHQGCRALINIGTNEKNRRTIAKQNGVDVLLDCLRTGTTGASLAAACWALRNIAVNDGNKKLIAQKGGIELIVKTMQNNLNDPQVQEQACWAFGNICLKEDTRNAMTKSGAVKALVEAMRNFPEHKKIQEAGCWAISFLVQNSQCREELRELGVKDLVMGSSNRFPGYENIEKYVTIIITALLDGKDTSGYQSDEEDEKSPALAAENTDKTDGANRPASTEIQVVRKGFLTKQGGRIKTWKKRWFVLDSKKLTYYRGMDEVSPLGTINMHMCDGILEDHSNKKPGFLIVTRARTYKIEAANRKELIEWINDIRKVQMSLAANTRPLSIDGKTYNKETSFGTTDVSLSKSFFDMPVFEKILLNEAPAYILRIMEEKIPKCSKYKELKGMEDLEFVTSNIGRNLIKEILTNRIDSTNITTLTGAKSLYYDANKLPAIIDEILDSQIIAVLNNKELLKSKPAKSYKFSQIASAQGMRKTMEDRHVEFPFFNTFISATYEPNISMFGVYDGHGGIAAANYVAENLHCNIIKELVDPTPPPVIPELEEVTLFADGPLVKEVISDDVVVVTTAESVETVTDENQVKLISDVEKEKAEEEAKAKEAESTEKEASSTTGTASFESSDDSAKEELKDDSKDAAAKKPNEQGDPDIEMVPSSPLTNDENEFVEAVKKAFLLTNDAFFDSLQRKNMVDASGSTGIVAFLRGKGLYTFWVGDSEGCLFFDNGSKPMYLSRPHKATLKSEQERIDKMGGFIQEVGGTPRLNGILAVTRSFGDSRLKRFVSPEPDYIKRDLDGTEKYMVLACDGLWDVMKPLDVEEFVNTYVKKKGTKGVASALVERALEKHSTDNVSVVIVFFK